jgi:hypothetical protein
MDHCAMQDGQPVIEEKQEATARTPGEFYEFTNSTS